MQNLNLIKFLILDVDGTLTDGGVYIDSDKKETKKFSVKDGAGIMLAQSVGIACVILTGRQSEPVEKRANELNIQYVYQGIKNKQDFLKDFIKNNKLSKEEIAYCGDDWNDIEAMKQVGFVSCPNNSADEVKKISHYISSFNGGYGAVRDCIEYILKQRKQYEFALNTVFNVE